MFETADVHAGGRRTPRWLADDLGLPPETTLVGAWRGARRSTRRCDPVERAVAQVPLFSTLARSRQRFVARMVTPLQLRERAVVAHEGSRPREFLVVVDGILEIVDGDGVVGTKGPGSHVGAGCLLAHRPRATSLVAATTVHALVVSDREFTVILHEVPELSERLHADIGRAALEGISPERAA